MQWLGGEAANSYQAWMGGIDGHETKAARAGPRVLACIPTLGGGGAERQVRLLGGRLVERGIGLSLFARLGAADVAGMTAAGVRCFPIRAPGNHNPLMALELWRAIRASRADIVHTFLPQMDIMGGAWALLTGRAWLLSERSSPQAYDGGLKNAARIWLGRHATAIVANNPAGLAVWPDHGLRPIIPNGLDFDAIAAAPAGGTGESAILAGRTIVLSVARLSPEKRLDGLVAATALLRDKVPDLLTVFIGEGPEEDALKALAAKLGVEAQTLFAGYRTDVWSWLKQASVFVGPSLFEGHPNAVLEAAAAGIPQILTDIPMHRDVVGDSGALFVTVDDPEQLASAILAQLGDADGARRTAAAARRHVDHLSIDQAADRYAALYRTLAEGT